MNEKIEELKKLIGTLDENSPLRAQLEAALREEQARLEAQAAKQDTPDEEPTASDQAAKQDTPDEEPTASDQPASSEPRDPISELIDKIDDLMQDDEFVSGLAGFLLGAATIGLGALAMSSIRKA